MNQSTSNPARRSAESGARARHLDDLGCRSLCRTAGALALAIAIGCSGCDAPPGADAPVNLNHSGAGGAQSTGSFGKGESRGSHSSSSGAHHLAGFTYDLPNGWSWADKDNLVAITNKPSKDEASGFVKFAPGVQAGAAEDAKKSATDAFDAWKHACATDPHDCLATPEFKEVKIAEVTVYMSLDKTQVESALPYWETNLAFLEDGYVLSANFEDRAELYTSELSEIIHTLRVYE